MRAGALGAGTLDADIRRCARVRLWFSDFPITSAIAGRVKLRLDGAHKPFETSNSRFVLRLYCGDDFIGHSLRRANTQRANQIRRIYRQVHKAPCCTKASTPTLNFAAYGETVVAGASVPDALFVRGRLSAPLRGPVGTRTSHIEHRVDANADRGKDRHDGDCRDQEKRIKHKNRPYS